jgi:DNA mismatch repair protein MutS2
MIPLPDLLHARPYAAADDHFLLELLEMAFLGSNESRSIDASLGKIPLPGETWNPDYFVRDLFVEDFLDHLKTLRIAGRDYPIHTAFVLRVLSRPPLDVETIHFRQRILEELENDEHTLARTTTLYVELVRLLDQLKSTHTQTLLDKTTLRLDTLRQLHHVVEYMVREFDSADSGLRRLHEVGLEIKASHEHETLRALLDYEDNYTRLDLRLRVGADGRIRNLEIENLDDNADNRFYLSPWRRWVEMLRLRWRGSTFTQRELVNRVILDVYRRIAPAFSTLVQVMGHLEVYLIAREFAARARAAGLSVCLAEVKPAVALELRGLFNPLLLQTQGPPVPCSVAPHSNAPVTVVTGPNSGGKTRLLQALGLAQLLGQSGLYVPAREARLPLASSMFASLVHQDGADLTEGRLGTELLRIRTLFQGVDPGAVVLIDELCSGTNPSEAAEIISMVLRLLRKLSPHAFITTHFLDLAKDLQDEPPIEELEFLQVEIDAHQASTYQFVPGVATTSLAVGTAQRLGVDFERLARAIDERSAR